MSEKTGQLALRGEMKTKIIRASGPGLGWNLRNRLRWSFVWGWLTTWLAKVFSRFSGIVTLTSELSIRAKLNGRWVNFGVVSRRVENRLFVAYVVDDWDSGANVIDNFNYHGCGTGAVAEAAGDIALGAECTTVLNPDSTRATGTKSQPAANQMRTIGTPAFDGAAAVTEHGVFTQAATGGGTLMDRSVFAVINVASGDSIQFTYTLTLNSGG